MKTDSLKIPFIISLIFHSLVLFSIASHLSSVKKPVMDIIPIEIINIEDKDITEPKTESLHPPLPEKPIQKIKEELPPKIEKKVIEEPKIAKAIEAPPLPAPIEKEIVKEAIVESPPPLIEETFEETADEAIIAESTIPSLNNNADGSETASLRDGSQFASGETISAEQTKPVGSELAASKANPYGVDGGVGSGNGEEMGLFRAMVRTKIERAKFYPRWARKSGFEGVVGVRFVVQPDGGVSDVKVVRPCNCEVLNKAACEAIMKAAPFNPRPVEVADKEMIMEIDISYRLD